MSETDDLQATLYDAAQILQRAILIVGGAPYWTHVCEQDHASIVIDGEKATLYWPESHSGYYDSCSIETQSYSFPSKHLLMTEEEIAAWHAEEKRKYDTEQKVKEEQEAKARAEMADRKAAADKRS